MTLREVGYMVLETIRDNKIVDDEKIDPRLIYAWIHLKRAEFIKKKQSTNPNNRVDHNLLQTQLVEVASENVTAAGNYPFSDDSVQDFTIVKSTVELPSIVEDKSGPIIYSVESEDGMKLPFSKTSYDQLRFSGNGRFNSNIVFYALRDKYLYFKEHSFFDTYSNVVIRAVFEDPTKITGLDGTAFTEDSNYPINYELMEYIKNAILSTDIRMVFTGKSDTSNDASGEINKN